VCFFSQTKAIKSKDAKETKPLRSAKAAKPRPKKRQASSDEESRENSESEEKEGEEDEDEEQDDDEDESWRRPKSKETLDVISIGSSEPDASRL
jgi:hypothetical protein